MNTTTDRDQAEVIPVIRDEHGNSEPYVKETIEDTNKRRPQSELDQDMKERLNSRRMKAIAARTGRILLWVILILALLASAGAALYMNIDKIVTDYDKYGSDKTDCIAKVGERTITGTRSYSYRYMTVLGYKIFMTPQSEVEQETRIDVNGNGMTILATRDGKATEKYVISDGEKERRLLKPADSYTFFMDGGKNTAILAYNQICK